MSEDTEFPIEQSICKDCVHRFSRFLIPLDYNSYGISLEEFEDLDDGEELIVEQHICLISQQDLDGVVRDCNKYRSEVDIAFFSKNPFDKGK